MVVASLLSFVAPHLEGGERPNIILVFIEDMGETYRPPKKDS